MIRPQAEEAPVPWNQGVRLDAAVSSALGSWDESGSVDGAGSVGTGVEADSE